MTAQEKAIELVDKMQKDFQYFASKEISKEMEKQQIIDACKKGYGSTAIFRYKLVEQYYNETFKSE